MVARIRQLVDSHHPAGIDRATTRDAGNQREPFRQLPQRPARLGGHRRIVRVGDDRRERPVDVESSAADSSGAARKGASSRSARSCGVTVKRASRHVPCGGFAA